MVDTLKFYKYLDRKPRTLEDAFEGRAKMLSAVRSKRAKDVYGKRGGINNKKKKGT